MAPRPEDLSREWMDVLLAAKGELLGVSYWIEAVHGVIRAMPQEQSLVPQQAWNPGGTPGPLLYDKCGIDISMRDGFVHTRHLELILGELPRRLAAVIDRLPPLPIPE